MSNVLIGIIGVVLFIGLAIAGTSYVGALVTDGTSQREASIVVSSLQQTAGAVKIYNMRNRRYLQNSFTAVDTLITAGILEERPANPLLPNSYPLVLDASGNATNERPAYVTMYLGQSEQALSTCIEIEIQNGNLDRVNPEVMKQPIYFVNRANTSRGGCARMPAAFNVPPNGGSDGDYAAWMPV